MKIIHGGQLSPVSGYRRLGDLNSRNSGYSP
jgi:hypothetical protein